MISYEERVMIEIKQWQRKMLRNPSFVRRITKGVQRKTNNLIPQKVHQAITATMKTMIHIILFGSEVTTGTTLPKSVSLIERDRLLSKKLNSYKRMAAVEGAGTGAGGILLGIADLPLLLGIKVKFLFDAATIYGFNVRNFEERLYILYLFQLAFSSEQRTGEVYRQILNWEQTVKAFPKNVEAIDWYQFQQEYRDYIDLAKLLQLIPGFGAAVGAFVNFRLLDKLGETTINGYRLRILCNR